MKIQLDKTIRTPASPFIEAVENKIIWGIPLETSFKMYKRKYIVKEETTFTEFLTTCSIVFLSTISRSASHDYRLPALMQVVFDRSKIFLSDEYKQILEFNLYCKEQEENGKVNS